MPNAIFVDCGDVLFDGDRAKPQWETLAGRYFSTRFGGKPEDWIRANQEAFDVFITQYQEQMWGHPEKDYNGFLQRELPRLVARMFTLMKKEPPAPEHCRPMMKSANEWINERVKAAIPGAVAAVRRLSRLGYRLYTCSGVDSSIVRAKLKAEEIDTLFLQHYGPDLINCAKEGALFYQKIFDDSGESASDSVVIDDKTMVLNWAAKTGATCIRIAAQNDDSGEYTAIEKFSDLPGILGH